MRERCGRDARQTGREAQTSRASSAATGRPCFTCVLRRPCPALSCSACGQCGVVLELLPLISDL